MSSYQDSLDNMMCLDVFLMGLSEQERQPLLSRLSAKKNWCPTLLCFDVIAMDWQTTICQKQTDLKYLLNLAQKIQWQENIWKILLQPFEALILTNVERKILWLNSGFEKMTGYKTHEAIGKKPTFLQGKNTNTDIHLVFRQKLQEGINFNLTVPNYRKSGEEYLCKVEIFPLHNAVGQISHFLALEQEIK